MSKNTLIGTELVGKKVILCSSKYAGKEDKRTFLCKSGLGCSPGLKDTFIYGIFISNGCEARIDRYDIEDVLND